MLSLVLAVALLPSQTALAPANISVTLPADARLFIDGNPTRSTGTNRSLQTPDLEVDQDYTYTLRAEIVRGGKVMTEEKKVSVSGAKDTAVTFFATGNSTRNAFYNANLGLSGVTLVGTENLGNYGRLEFRFADNGQATMIDTDGATRGTYSQQGKKVTLSFYNGSVVYSGDFNGTSLAGTASNNKTSWTYEVSMQETSAVNGNSAGNTLIQGGNFQGSNGGSTFTPNMVGGGFNPGNSNAGGNGGNGGNNSVLPNTPGGSQIKQATTFVTQNGQTYKNTYQLNPNGPPTLLSSTLVSSSPGMSAPLGSNPTFPNLPKGGFKGKQKRP